jgi:RNA polymerase sigma-70 factor (ECF subfamily)
MKGWLGNRQEEPEELALQKEERQSVQYLLSELPDKYRLIIYLYYYKQLSYQEISNVTQLPLKTIETRLYRGKSLLKQKWQEVRNLEQTTSERTTASTIPK